MTALTGEFSRLSNVGFTKVDQKSIKKLSLVYFSKVPFLSTKRVKLLCWRPLLMARLQIFHNKDAWKLTTAHRDCKFSTTKMHGNSLLLIETANFPQQKCMETHYCSSRRQIFYNRNAWKLTAAQRGCKFSTTKMHGNSLLLIESARI